MAGPRKIVSTREPGRAFDVLEPETGVPEVYADGFAGMTFSSSVMKVGLYLSTTPLQEGDITVEQRMVNVKITMPTANFVEMCIAALMSIKSNRPLLEQALGEQRQKIMAVFDVVQSTNRKGGPSNDAA